MTGNKRLAAVIGCVSLVGMLSLLSAGCEELKSTGLPGAVGVNSDGADPGDPSAQNVSNSTDGDGGNSGGQDADDEPADPAGDASEDEANDLFAALADRFYSFGSSSFFSSGSITESDELETCAFGRFGMRITRITSTSLDTFSSEDVLLGVWSVQGGTVILNIDDATDTADIGTQRQFAVEIDGSEAVFFDGARADVNDAAADCAAAQ